MPASPAKKTKYQVNSLERAFRILGCFSLAQPELTLNEICDRTALPKPTVFRLLSAMETARFIARTPDGQRYQVGVRAFELGNIFLANLSIERIARPYMEELSKEFGMTCNLAILDQGKVVYIAVANHSNLGRFSPITGYRHYVHCSALGKALIAGLPEGEVRDILAEHGMPSFSEFTLTNPDDLISDLGKVRARGVALDDQEGGLGTCCLAVPIYDHTGQRTAAISLSGASPLFNPEQSQRMQVGLAAASQEISGQLGYSPRT